MFDKMDTWQLTAWQRAMDWATPRTGVSNWAAARFFIVVWAASIGALYFKYSDSAAMRVVSVLLALSALLLVYASFLVVEQLQEDTSRLGVNIAQVAPHEKGIRIYSTVMLAVFLGLDCLILSFGPADVGLIAYWAHYYARACNEAPPPKEEYAPNALPEGA